MEENCQPISRRYPMLLDALQRVKETFSGVLEHIFNELACLQRHSLNLTLQVPAEPNQSRLVNVQIRLHRIWRNYRSVQLSGCVEARCC